MALHGKAILTSNSNNLMVLERKNALHAMIMIANVQETGLVQKNMKKLPVVIVIFINIQMKQLRNTYMKHILISLVRLKALRMNISLCG
jgi:hypothetical protein